MSRVVTVAATQMACSWDRAAIARFREIAAELRVVLPISFFERAGRARFSSVAIIDADGSNLSASTGKAISPTAPATTRSTTSTRATPALGCGTPPTP